MGMKIARIVVGVEGSEGSAKAMLWTADLARRTRASVVVVHAGDIPAYPTAFWGPGGLVNADVFDKVMEALQQQLDGEWTQPLRDAGVTYSTRLEPGDPAVVLIDVVREEKADLLVAGRRGRGGFSELVLGSVSHHLVHHSPVPITVVPPG